MKLRFFGFNILVKLARKKTVWWVNLPEGTNKPAQRVDHLFSINRTFIREPGIYLYSIKIGRLGIMIGDDRNSRTNVRLQRYLQKIKDSE